MIITIVSVEQGQVPAGKKYKMIEVAYKGEDGKVAGKKIMDFSYPTVYNTLKAASQGDKFDVTAVKEGDYWNWSEIKKAEGNVASTTSNTAPSTTQAFAASSNDRYETKEERQARQKYIIRQSSLSTAVETLAVGSKGVDPDKVVELARKYEAYVFETNPIQELMDMSDDLPD